MGTVDGFVATGGPAGAATHARRVIAAADVDFAIDPLFLEMAFEAEDGIAFDEHAWVDRAVGLVAGGAALADGLVFEGEGAALGNVATAAGVVFGGQCCSAAGDDLTLVRIMTIAASDLALLDGVVGWKAESAFHFEMALEAGVGGFEWINDGGASAAGFGVETAGAVAGFAADIDGVGSLGLQAGVGRGVEILGDGLMALGAIVGADVSGSGDVGRRHEGSLDGGAGGERDAPHGRGEEEDAGQEFRVALEQRHRSATRNPPSGEKMGVHKFRLWETLDIGRSRLPPSMAELQIE